MIITDKAGLLLGWLVSNWAGCPKVSSPPPQPPPLPPLWISAIIGRAQELGLKCQLDWSPACQPDWAKSNFNLRLQVYYWKPNCCCQTSVLRLEVDFVIPLSLQQHHHPHKSQLLLTWFWPKFKRWFLGTSRKDSYCRCDRQRLSWRYLSISGISQLLPTLFWPNFLR